MVRHKGARLRALVACASFIYGDLRAIVSGTMDIGEMVRHKGAPQSSHHMGFAGHCRGGDPVAFLAPCLCRRMLSTKDHNGEVRQ